MNQCNFIGRLGKDPEIRHTQDGKPVANFSIAVSEKWKDKNGNKQESTEWVPIVFFGKVAEIVERYIHKGDQIQVTGKMQTRKWQDKEGNDRYTTEINGRDLNMLGGNKQSQSREPGSDDGASEFDDDIPF